MAYTIEVLALGKTPYDEILKIATRLNSLQRISQESFYFKIPEEAFKDEGRKFDRNEYDTQDVFKFLREYKKKVGGHRPFVIGVVSNNLKSDARGAVQLFGSHTANEEHLAVVSTFPALRYVSSIHAYLGYYLIRYSLSFIDSSVKNHNEEEKCFFHRKDLMSKIKESLLSGGYICDICSEKLESSFNQETVKALKNMAEFVKNLEDGSVSIDDEIEKNYTASSPIWRKIEEWPWIIWAIIGALISGIVYAIGRNFPNTIEYLLVFIVVFVIILLFAPFRRYMKYSWSLLGLLATAHILPFSEIKLRVPSSMIGSETINGILLDITSKTPGPSFNYSIIALASLCLILDFLQRNKKG